MCCGPTSLRSVEHLLHCCSSCILRATNFSRRACTSLLSDIRRPFSRKAKRLIVGLIMLFELRGAVALHLLAFSYVRPVLCGVPWRVSWSDQAVGPDGPWNALMVGIDTPPQNLTMFPSLSEASLLVDVSACQSQDSACSLPIDTMWSNSTAHASFGWMNGASFNMSTTYYPSTMEPLRLQGQGLYTHETLQLYNEPKNNLDTVTSQGLAWTDNTTINYPGGSSYTMDVGLFSLYGAQDNFTWTASNGSSVTLSRTLPSIYDANIITSKSYALHVGSPTFDIDGSLVLGGYDRSRCLTDPITSDNDTFQLQKIGFDVANSTVTTSYHYNITSEPLVVYPNPSVPYMYLPKSACDAMASHLPVTYDSKFGLYMWNTDLYGEYISSPYFLSFEFASSSSTANTTIHVPFALLNLTLETPLVSTSTQYFPCSPYSPSDGTTYHLGRAFLQAAFLSKNWQTNKTWLAQAPGPSFASEQLTILEPYDTSLTPMANAPDWIDTWDKVYRQSSSYSSTSGSSGSSTSLSGGAIAGIVIGVIAAVALIAAAGFLLWRRRRRAASAGARNGNGNGGNGNHQELKEYPVGDGDHSASMPLTAGEVYSQPVVEAPHSEIHEVAGLDKKDKYHPPAEMEGGRESQRHPVELPGERF